MTGDELRARLAAIVAAAQPGRIAHGTEVTDLLDRPPVPAAVLVPFVLGAAPGVLLTKRTAHLTKHAGQVSFPGGRIDPDGRRRRGRGAARGGGGDRARSGPGGRRWAGWRFPHRHRLPHHAGGRPAAAGPGVPARRRTRWRRCSSCRCRCCWIRTRRSGGAREVQGRRREFWVWPHPEHYIWGATAAILVHLARALRARGVSGGRVNAPSRHERDGGEILSRRCPYPGTCTA